jgi:hypothetical protein
VEAETEIKYKMPAERHHQPSVRSELKSLCAPQHGNVRFEDFVQGLVGARTQIVH